jgi:hypothetical protein
VFAVADVIFPAFYTPYVVQLLRPIAAVAGLTAEFLFYFWWNGKPHPGRLATLVIVANVASSVTGVVIASFLPTGYNPAFRSTGRGPWHDASWNNLAIIAWVFAFVISVLIEWPIVVAFRRFVVVPRAFAAVVFANATSYLVLLGVVFVSSLS